MLIAYALAMKTFLHSAPSTHPILVSGAKGTALHRQMFLVLNDEIARGMFPDGALPNEQTLGERFGVSRITVRRALADLAASGVVERRHGRGTFVREGRPPVRPPPSLSVIDSLRQAATQTVVRVLEVVQTEPPPDLAKLLQLAPGVTAVHALRLRLNGEGVPAMLTDAWVPAALGESATRAALKKKALYEILIAQGVQFGRVVQEITAVAGDPMRAGLLRTEVGAPLLKLVRLMHDQAQRPVLHLTAYLVAERASIWMEADARAVNTLAAGQIVFDRPVA